jgi:two-component system response regulator NreC
LKKIRLLIADDHTLVRQGVRSLLETQDDIEVVAEASGGHEAIAKAAEFRPDVILMDLAMPDLNGMEATRRIRSEHHEIQVVALTMHGTDDYLFRVLEAGASGYVLKEADAAELTAAIRAVHAGGAFIYPSLAKRLVEQFLQRVGSGEERSSYDNLTPREKEILDFIGEGLTNEEIADRLSLSVHTVQTHRSNIMEKLGLHNRAQLVTYAVRVGLIRQDSD